jgi:hypothetical protein
MNKRLKINSSFFILNSKFSGTTEFFIEKPRLDELQVQRIFAITIKVDSVAPLSPELRLCDPPSLSK